MDRRTFLGAALACVASCGRPAPTDPPRDVPTAQPSPAAPPPSLPYPLFDAFPALADAIPRLVLGSGPSRVDAAPALGAAIGVPRLFAKRDDLASDVYAGGKLRKLELLLAAAIASGKDTVVTFGGAGSNQAVATALFARCFGLRARLLLAPQPAGPHVRANLLADAAAGAEILFVTSVSEAERRAARAAEPSVALIPPGGTCALGTLAFASAGLELARDVARGACPRPDVVVVPLGTTGTAAGLALGLRLAGLDATVLGVRASTPATSSAAAIAAAHAGAVAAARAIDPRFPDVRLARGDVEIDGAHLGGGYGVPTAAGAAAAALAAREGWALEPVYGAKALAAVADRARSLADRTVLFWCTHSAAPLPAGDVAALPPALRRYVT